MFIVTIDYDSYSFESDTEKETFSTKKEAKDFIYKAIKSLREYEGEGEGDFDLEAYYSKASNAYLFDTYEEETYIYRIIES